MRPGISITLSPAERRRLEALVRDRNTAQKYVWRAEIVLLSVEGIGTNEIMHRTGKSKTCVWRWQKRFAEEGCDGLLREKTRPPRIPPLGADVAERVPVPCRSFATVSASLRTNWRIGPKGKNSQQRSFGLSDVGLSISTRR